MYNTRLIAIIPNLELCSLDPLVNGGSAQIRWMQALIQSKILHISTYGPSCIILGPVFIGPNSFLISFNSMINLSSIWKPNMWTWITNNNAHSWRRTKTTLQVYYLRNLNIHVSITKHVWGSIQEVSFPHLEEENEPSTT